MPILTINNLTTSATGISSQDGFGVNIKLDPSQTGLATTLTSAQLEKMAAQLETLRIANTISYTVTDDPTVPDAAEALSPDNTGFFCNLVTLAYTEGAAGKDLVPTAAVPYGKKIYLWGARVLGTNSPAAAWAGTMSNLIIQDKASSPVAVVTIAKAALTATCALLPASANVTLSSAYFTGCTAAKGLSIISDGTCTNGATLDILVFGQIK